MVYNVFHVFVLLQANVCSIASHFNGIVSINLLHLVENIEIICCLSDNIVLPSHFELTDDKLRSIFEV
jgi:hypothetical protein